MFIKINKTGKEASAYKPELHIMETRYCTCNCGKNFVCATVSKKRYIQGHSFTKKCFTLEVIKEMSTINLGNKNPNYKPENHVMETRYCACNCGETFECSTKSEKKYIKGHHRKGINHTQNSLTKMSEAKLGKHTGENNPGWKGGISFEEYPMEFSKIYKETIRTRDNHKCQIDPAHDNKGKTMHVHHIDYDKMNCDPKNLTTLCNSCNLKANFNREYWIMYFDNLLSITQPYS